MARRSDAGAREVFEHAAQHLKHAGFDPLEASKLLGGMTVEKYEALAAGAERRHPKRCKGSCFTPGSSEQLALCPYCAHCAVVHGDMMGAAIRASSR